MTTDTDTLVARLRTLPPCQAHNLEAADRIAALEAEVARCHARLEITHVGQMKGDGTADLIRVEVPMAERATMPDGIDARDATIYLLDEDIARLSASLVAEVTESERVRAQLAEAMAGEDELLKGLREIAAITERKENKFPSDWSDQIAACPECQRYKGHPIQNGICDQHRKPIYAQEDHDRHETKILGYRAQDIARSALASHDKRKEGR